MMVDSVSHLKWITAFLKDHAQCVYLGVDLSPPISDTSGVPQGSVLAWPSIVYVIYK